MTTYTNPKTKTVHAVVIESPSFLEREARDHILVCNGALMDGHLCDQEAQLVSCLHCIAAGA